MKGCIGLVLSVLLSVSSFGQHDWWVKKHNWDGVTHWSDYIIISPDFMGPNALPVPEAQNGMLTPHPNVELAVEKHFNPGDQTQNLFAKCYIPLHKDRVGFNLSVVPVESYNMDTLTRDRRRSRDYDGEGSSVGDFYLGTYIQLIKDAGVWPDILLTVNIKTASGDKLSAARHTDSPGYFFDLSFGKNYPLRHVFFRALRPYALFGFYSWQTNRTDYHQNDAIMYGLGLNTVLPFFELDQYLGGYTGYIGNGDRPMVYRISLRTRRDAPLNYKLRFQEGLRDYDYRSFRLGVVWNLEHLFDGDEEEKKKVALH